MPTLRGSHAFFADPVYVVGKGWRRAVLDQATVRAPPLVLLDKPRRVLRTAVGDDLAAGDVVILAGGERFVVATQGAGPGGVSRSWVMFDVTGAYRVARRALVGDVVTGKMRPGGAPTVRTLDLCVEPLGSERAESATRVVSEAYRVVAGVELRLGDAVRVNGTDRLVTRVNPRMGVWVGELG